MRLFLLLLALAAAPAFAQSEWRLRWSDEFDGPRGARPDPAKWTYDTGANGWGNHELENYTTGTRNASLDGAGHLLIRVEKTASGYTSARLKTQGLFTARYGKVEARLKLPYGQGIWPAFWMLGAGVAHAGWPECGEIDIVENIGKEPATLHGSVHGPGYSGGKAITAQLSVAEGRLADDLHIYSLIWETGRLEFQFDGKSYQTVTPASLPKGAVWVFDRPFFLILNVAAGGAWPGSPDASTVFPQTLTADWVRVYERADR